LWWGEAKLINEFDRIILNDDLPRCGLERGDVGTVVMIHQGGEGSEVEFFALDGETAAVATLEASQVRPIRPRQVAQARDLAVA